MFGMVAASGIQILHEANITDRRNQLLVAVSIGMGMVPVVRRTSSPACRSGWSRSPIAASP